MSTKKDVLAHLPAADALPPSVFDHPTLHAIMNAYHWCETKKAILAKFEVTGAYFDAVVYQYAKRFDT